MKRKVDGIRSGEMQVKEEADTTTVCHRRKKQQNVGECTLIIESPMKPDIFPIYSLDSISEKY